MTASFGKPAAPALSALNRALPKKRPLALAVASALAFLSLPAVAQTSQWGTSPATTVNNTQINFAGHEWVVIGNAGTDIYNTGVNDIDAPPNSVTLLLRNGDAGGDFGTSAFRLRPGNGSDPCASNYAGTCDHPSDYKDSTLQNRMEEIAGSLPAKEQAVINERTLQPEGDGINGSIVEKQKLWALSYPEWFAIDASVRSYSSVWWLRSPGYNADLEAQAGWTNGDTALNGSVDQPSAAVRPAFNLSLDSVLFTSESGVVGAGKSAAIAEGGYTQMAQPSALTALKLTFLDRNIDTPTLTLKSALTFDFADASGVSADADPAANPKQYVSGFLTQDATTDYYAKYANTTSYTSGNFDAKPTGTGDGNYELHIFREEANDDLYSDFASPSVDFTFTLDSGNVQNLTLTSDSPFSLDGGAIGLLDSSRLTYKQDWTLGMGGGTLDIQNGVNAKISGGVSGNGGLTKDGAGTLILSGKNTYDGATYIIAGTLDLTGSLSNSNVSVGNATFALHGNAEKDVTLSSNSTLNTYQGSRIGGNLSAQNAALNFYLPGDIVANQTLLTVTGNANIAGSTVSLALDGSAESLDALNVTESVKLLHADGGLSGNSSNPTATIKAGVAFSAEFGLSTDNSNNLIATLNSKTNTGDGNTGGGDTGGSGGDTGGNGGNSGGGVHLNPQTKAFSEGFLGGLAFLNQGADFAADKGMSAALQSSASRALSSSTGNHSLGFAALGGGRLRHNTGSHVDVDGYSLVAGLAGSKNTDAGELTLGAFIEHGEGNYNSYNSFANAASIHGKGDTKYTGGGLLTRFAFNATPTGQLYVEATARAGKADTDFKSNLRDGFGRSAEYDTKTGYLGGHVGVGYVLNLNERSKLDLYAQYLWSRQNDDKVKLTTGETVKFSAVDSQRTRLGAKWLYPLSQQTSAYVGAAWEHEYDGKAKASIYGYKLDAPKLRGDTGMAEIGFHLTPTQNKALTLDIGVQAHTGKREGVTGSLQVKWAF